MTRLNLFALIGIALWLGLVAFVADALKGNVWASIAFIVLMAIVYGGAAILVLESRNKRKL